LFGRLDGWLEGKRYVAGQHFTMGDIPVGCFVYRWYALDIVRPDLKNVRAWYERLGTRPAYAKHIMIKLT
jgi:glutathione S-transferase